MAFWNRMRERVGWDREPDRERNRWGGWRDDYRRDFGRSQYDYDRGYGSRWGSGDYRASYERDRGYGRHSYPETSYQGYGGRDYDRDRWTPGMREGSFDDYDRYDVWHDRGRRSSADFDFEPGRGGSPEEWDRNRNRW